MAYYEMMPAGLPAGLQSDMDSVLNKKFGTSTSYAPGTWPDTVNLMGPLPEAIASGSIVTFSDGADDVPLKSCEVALPPSLDGKSAVVETQTGKNIFTSEIETGNINSSGENEANAFRSRTKDYIRMPTNELVLSYVGDFNNGVFWYDKDKTFISYLTWGASPRALTPPNNAYYVRFSFLSATYPTSLQLEEGRTPSSYEPYNGTTYTAQLGRTIHGGSVDVVKGEGTGGYGKITDFSALTANGTSSTGAHRYRLIIADCAVYTDRKAISSEPLTFRASFNGSVNEFYNASGYLLIFLSQDNVSDAIEYLSGVSIVYPLATPTDFTFEPVKISSKLGDNTMWSDGDMSVTYRRDIDLALQALSGSRGLMMARPQLEPETEETEPEETIEETPEDMER